MADMIRTAVVWLGARLAESAVSSIAYTRASGTAYTIDATPAEGATALDPSTGAIISSRGRDFIVQAAEFPAALAPPAAGDRIVFETVNYEVCDISGIGAWQWMDAYHLMMRIHAKEVGAE